MTAEAVFNAYLDANIILLLAAALWMATRFLLSRRGLRQPCSTQLQLLYGLLIAVVLAPLVIAGFHLIQNSGWIVGGYNPSVSDYALAQFLNGRFDMAPSQFETLWMARTEFTREVAGLRSTFGQAVALGLGLGLLICTLRLLRNGYAVWALVRGGYHWRRVGRVDIRFTDEVAIPFSTRGLQRHYILLPSALLSRAGDLRIAVAHELQHVRQGDLWGEVALEILRPLFFWNPAFALLKRDVEEMRELACDEAVLQRRTMAVRDYGDCLLRVCHGGLGQGIAKQVYVPAVPLVSPLHGRRSARLLKRRFVMMLGDRRRGPGRLVTALMVLPLAGAISFAAIASQSSGDWTQDRLMLSTIVNLERLDQRTIATRY